MATEAYQRFFDTEFKPPPDIKSLDDEMKARDIVVALNNRAVMSQFKIQSHHLGKRVSENDNQAYLDFQMKLF